MIIGMNETFGK